MTDRQALAAAGNYIGAMPFNCVSSIVLRYNRESILFPASLSLKCQCALSLFGLMADRLTGLQG